MKLLHSTILACSLAALAPRPALPQELAEDGVRIDGSVNNTRGTLSVKDATPDEFLLAVARAGDVNLIADTTPQAGTEPAPAPITRQVDSVAEGFLYDAAKTEGLRYKYFGDRTFLFWRPPQDAAAVAQHIVDEMAAAQRAVPPLTSKQVQNLWYEYFTREHGWDGKQDAVINVQVADLPAPLRERTLAAARKELMALMTGPYQFFASEVWPKTSFVVQPLAQENGRPAIPQLRWRVPMAYYSPTIGLGRLDALAGRAK